MDNATGRWVAAELAGTLPAERKRPYAPPVLILFGRVAALTQSGSNCTDDNGVCQSVATNMGPTKGSSDRRLKTNIVRIGTHPLDIGLYLFDYKAEPQSNGMGRQFGVMADEVEQVMPMAVHVQADGYKFVDYEMLGIRALPR
jgi:hypothetical protein